MTTKHSSLEYYPQKSCVATQSKANQELHKHTAKPFDIKFQLILKVYNI